MLRKFTDLLKHSKSRFKSPLPGLYDGTMNDVSKESKIQCVQLVNLTSFAGQEDCLFLNIYVPETVYNDPFPGAPVMVFIHGGGLVSKKIHFNPNPVICTRNQGLRVWS